MSRIIAVIAATMAVETTAISVGTKNPSEDYISFAKTGNPTSNTYTGDHYVDNANVTIIVSPSEDETTIVITAHSLGGVISQVIEPDMYPATEGGEKYVQKIEYTDYSNSEGMFGEALDEN